MVLNFGAAFDAQFNDFNIIYWKNLFLDDIYSLMHLTFFNIKTD